MNAFIAAQRWSREQTRLEKEKRCAERVANLKQLLEFHHVMLLQSRMIVLSRGRSNWVNQSETVAKIKHLRASRASIRRVRCVRDRG